MVMSKMSWLKTNWKLVLNIVTIGALVILAYAIRHQLGQTFDDLARVNAWALLLIVPIEWLNYHAQAKIYQGLFAILGNKVDYRKLYKMALELNFVNSVFPSGGASGISYFGVRLRDNDITAGKASLVQITKIMLVLISFEALMIVGLLMLALGGRVNNLTILVAGSLSTLLVVGTLALMFIIGSHKRIDGSIRVLSMVLHSVLQILHLGRLKPDVQRLRHWGNELHTNYVVLRTYYKQLLGPLAYGGLANLTEVLAVYVVYIAFGHWVNLGAIILAYSVANFAGLISVLPGGLGTYEAIMTGVLVASGIPASLTISVIIMYRVVNTLIQLPPGYWFYHQNLRRKVEPAANG